MDFDRNADGLMQKGGDINLTADERLDKSFRGAKIDAEACSRDSRELVQLAEGCAMQSYQCLNSPVIVQIINRGYRTAQFDVDYFRRPKHQWFFRDLYGSVNPFRGGIL